MSSEEHDALFAAFEAVFVDMFGRGLADYDPFLLDRMWCHFLKDLAEGFPSLMKSNQAQ